MTIKVYPDRIEFNTYTIKNTPTGIDVNGTFNAINWDYYNVFQGSINGYASGGNGTPGNSSIIDVFPFASFTTGVQIGSLNVPSSPTDLNQVGFGHASASSSTHGYAFGRYVGTIANRTDIQKFPFASSFASATVVGDSSPGSTGGTYGSGHSSSTHGYAAGGSGYPIAIVTMQNNIEKYPFSVDNTFSIDVGNLSLPVWKNSGSSSTTNGYSLGGSGPPTPPNQGALTNSIQKFSFVNDGGATNVASLLATTWELAGQSSTVSGYSSGGDAPPVSPTAINVIQKFPFATDSNSTDVGDLTVAKDLRPAGISSTTYGYTAGGSSPSPPGLAAASNIIDRFSFSTDGNASDVGDLSQARYDTAGHEV